MREGATLEMRVKGNDVKGTAAMMLSSRLSRGEHLLGLAELVTSQADIAKVVIPPIDQGREQRCRGGTAAAGRAGLLVDPLSTLPSALVAAWQSGWEPGWQRAVTGVRPVSAATRVAPSAAVQDSRWAARIGGRRVTDMSSELRAVDSGNGDAAGTGGGRGRRSLMAWQVLSALFLLAMGGIHLYLVVHGVGGLLGVLFVLNAVGALVLAIVMVVLRRRLLRVASVLSLLFMVGTLLALVLALTIGLFGIRETLDFQLVSTTLVVESIGTVVLVVATALLFRLRRAG